jgi:hypothetical protein
VKGWPRFDRRWLQLAAAFAAVVALTLAARGARWAASRWGGVTGGAEWIWQAHDRRHPAPAAFYAVRDFAVAEPPPQHALLMALGDAEYVLYLNGKRVGAGGWRPGARLDAYEVGALLRPGGNRLLAELRSADGAGGFVASLVDEADGRALVVTDDSWRIFERHRLGLLRGWLPVAPLAFGSAVPAAAVAASAPPAGVTSDARAAWTSAAGPGAPAVAWGRPPLGRWGRVVPAWRRPLFDDLTRGAPPRPAAAIALYRPPALTGVAGDAAMVLFDFGREVTGYLELDPGYEPAMDPDLEKPPPDRQRTALLWTGEAPPEPATASGVPPDGAVMVMPGAGDWLDARLRRFRYALVIGIARPLGARVYAIDERLAATFRLDVLGQAAGQAAAGEPGRDGRGAAVGPGAAPMPEGAGGVGVFGLAPPRLRTPVENEVRSKLERLPGVAGRKKL